MNPRQLRQQAEAEKAKAAFHLKRAAFLERTAAEYEALTAHDSTRKISHMHVSESALRRAVRGRPSTSSHPFPAALEERGTTLSAWARQHGYSRTAANSWYLAGATGRKIPRPAAAAIEKEFGIAATDENWPNGIKA